MKDDLAVLHCRVPALCLQEVGLDELQSSLILSGQVNQRLHLFEIALVSDCRSDQILMWTSKKEVNDVAGDVAASSCNQYSSDCFFHY